MRRIWSSFCVAFAVATMLVGPVDAATIMLDADTVATGSNLDVAPLVTPYGTITFSGQLQGPAADAEFIAAGASGDVFDIDGSSTATLSFDFDVLSVTFIYGGNAGVFDIEARDVSGGVLDSFFQADTEVGPAGPITLYGPGIRSLFWEDPPRNFAAIDNVVIEVADAPVPEPASMLLLGMGLTGLAVRRRMQKK